MQSSPQPYPFPHKMPGCENPIQTLREGGRDTSLRATTCSFPGALSQRARMELERKSSTPIWNASMPATILTTRLNICLSNTFKLSLYSKLILNVLLLQYQSSIAIIQVFPKCISLMQRIVGVLLLLGQDPGCILILSLTTMSFIGGSQSVARMYTSYDPKGSRMCFLAHLLFVCLLVFAGFCPLQAIKLSNRVVCCLWLEMMLSQCCPLCSLTSGPREWHQLVVGA